MAANSNKAMAAPSRLSQWIGYAAIAGLRLSAIGIGVLYVKLYTGTISAEALGLFFYLTTLSYALNAFVFVPFDFFIQAKLATQDGALPLKALARVAAAASGIALTIAMVGGIVLLFFGKIAPGDMIGAFTMAVLLAGCTSGRNLLNNRGARLFVVIMFVFESIGRVAALLVVSSFARPDGRLLFYSSGSALLLELVIIGFWTLRTIGVNRSAPSTSDDLSVRSFVKSAIPISISAACNLVQLQSFRLLWVWAGFPASAAIFAVVANVGASGMSAAGQVMSQILLPRVYQTRGAFAWTYFRLAAVAIAIVLMVGLVFSYTLVSLLTTDHYVPYAPLLGYGVLVEGANLLISGATAVMMLRSQIWKMLPCNIAGATVALVGNGLALYFFPTMPAAIGVPLLASQIVVLGTLAMLMMRAAKE